MQTLTFTQKLLRQRRFLSFLIPLLALFVGLGASQTVSAQRYTASNLTISAAPTGGPATSTTYYIRPTTATPQLNGAVLGGGTAFNQNAPNQGSLTLNATAVAINSAGTTITPSFLYYRVYSVATGATVPDYTPVNLTLTSVDNTNSNPVTYALSNASIDLLNQPSVLGGGTYYVEVYFESAYNDIPASSTGTFRDPSTTARATFTVNPPTVTPSGGTTTWISDGVAPKNTNWLNPANWSNGVPTRNSNAIFPPKPPAGPFTVTPSLNDPNALYEVQTLTLQDPNNDTRALVRVGQSVSNGNATAGTSPIGATLRIYGDLNNLGGGLLASVSGTNGTANPALNSTVVFAGDAATFTLDANGNQVLTGGNQIIRGLTTVVDVRIEGTGIKGVVNVIQATNTFTFATANAIVRTITDSPSLALNTSKIANVELGPSGILLNETNNAFIEGITMSERTLMAGVKQTFGNIGIDITPDRDIPAPAVIITRTVGRPFSGPLGTTRVAVKRQYGTSGDVNNNTTSTLVLHYLDSNGVNSPYNELNGNPEPNLVIFKTGNNGVPFQLVGGTVSVADNTVTKSGVTSINTVTLGDKENPLPVRLTAFDAKRVGTDALVTWETASEENSRGYEVQVSTTGKEFRTLVSIASAAPNTNRTTQYRYIDTETNKSGTRYYRLRQVDLDGKEAFFNPVAVSFTGKATETALVAYPNPINGNEQLHLTFQSANAGKGQISITDMTGRMVRQQPIDVTAGTSDLTVEKLGDLKMGMYLVRLTLPSGQVQNLKVVKQ